MFTLKSGKEYLDDFRAIDERLQNLRINGIIVDKKTLTIKYNFICDRFVDEELKEKLLDAVEKVAPAEFRFVEVAVKKIATNDELINNAIYRYVQENYPSAAIFLKPTDVVCATVGDVVKYTVRLPKTSADYFLSGGAIRKINEFLGKNFCADFAGTVEEKELEETVDLTQPAVFLSELEKVEHRTIKVDDVVVIDDASIGNIAQYIEDAASGDVTVCGTITDIAEKTTKKDKPFLIIHLNDTTGSVSGLYFSKKTTWNSIKNLQVGDAIIARGNLGSYNGHPSLTFEKINRCTFPKDFVKKDKFKKKAPSEYKLIFPTPAEERVSVKSVFDVETPLPQEVLDTEYVVFDLETTGIDLLTNGITEIGAVKIRGGKLVEQFTTLIKPDYPITEKITELTGIDEEMVKNAPKISQVIPDFMKFIDGATLIAHNADFDVRFIKRFASAEEYDVKNKVIDTLDLSRRTYPNRTKHDLHTLAEGFGIEFRHHRAMSDAYATAECFLEIMKINEKS